MYVRHATFSFFNLQVGLLFLAPNVGLQVLYEPPTWLNARGRTVEATEVHASITAYNNRNRAQGIVSGPSIASSSRHPIERDASQSVPDEEVLRDHQEGGEDGVPSEPRSSVSRASTSRTSLLASTHSVAQALFSPGTRRLTVTLCGVHALLNLGFTAFNVFLPTLLEQIGTPSPQTLHPSREIVGGTWEPSRPLFVRVVQASRPSSGELRASLLGWLSTSLGGIAGSIMGAWLSGRASLGRVGTLISACSVASISIFLAAIGWGPVLCSTVASLSSASAYAALYSYTAEVYPPSVRGLGSGTAMAASRAAGIVAPLLAGALNQGEKRGDGDPHRGDGGGGGGGTTMNTRAPLFFAAMVLAACAVGPAYLLPYETLPKAAAERAAYQRPQNTHHMYASLPQEPEPEESAGHFHPTEPP